MIRLLAAAVLALASAGAGSPIAAPEIAGCPIFPATNPWNQRVDELPVAKNSATLIRAIGLDRPLHADFGSGLYDGEPIGIPYNVVPAAQPTVHVTFEYADESDHVRYPIPQNVHTRNRTSVQVSAAAASND